LEYRSFGCSHVCGFDSDSAEYSNHPIPTTPLLGTARLEDEDDDEYENEGLVTYRTYP